MSGAPATPELSLMRVTRSKLAETVAQQLLAQLRDKRPAPGTKIPSERELMAALGVGRSTIREAIHGLAMLGVLEIRHGQGAFVVDPNPSMAIGAALARGVTRELFEARLLVETHTASLAAERRTDADLRDLERSLVDYQAAIDRGEAGVEPSVRFHVTVAQAAHSSVLAGFVSLFADAMTERGRVLAAEPGFQEWDLAQHRAVVEPIRAGEPARAARRMRRHLEAVVPFHQRIGLAE